MNKQNKIAAFTMVDILTGMVITSIIISMVFYLFSALNKQMFDYGKTRNELNTFLLLRTDLKRQFNAANNNLIGIPNGISLDTEIGNFTYLKEGDLLLRKSEFTVDTLSKNLQEFEVLFTKNKNGNPTQNVRAVNLTLTVNQQLLSCHFYKNYGSVEQINKVLLNEF